MQAERLIIEAFDEVDVAALRAAAANAIKAIGAQGEGFDPPPAGADSPGRPGLERERDPREEAAAPPEPPPTQPLGFEADIKGLFRDRDRNAMRQIAGFDLHNLDDVKERAASILARVSDGTMPCDTSWPPERVAKFKKWIDDGKQP